MDIPENCTDVRSALHLFVGGDLPEEVLEAVTLHLDGCAGCREHATRAGEAREALLVLAADGPPPASVWPALRTRLGREGHLPGAPAPRRTPWLLVPVAAAASAAAALAVLFFHGDPSVPSSPISASPMAPERSRPVALQPVEEGAAPLFEVETPERRFAPFGSPGASAAGNPARPVSGGTPVPHRDTHEIVR